MKNKPHKLWVLFLTTLYISAFTFGGGFVIVTFMKHKFVENYTGLMNRKCLILQLWHSPVREQLL